MRNIRITILLFATLILVFLGLLARCIYLQRYRYEHYSVASERQQRAFATQQPQRGVILDSRGRVLAASNKVQSIFADPQQIAAYRNGSQNQVGLSDEIIAAQNIKDTATELAPIVGVGAHIVCRTIMESGNPRFVRIVTGADPSQCELARQIRGIGVQSDFERHYPLGNLAPHVIGFVSNDNRGLEGIELKYDEQLSGLPGKSVFYADARRRPIRLMAETAAVTDGVGLILTIDATIQEFARAALEKRYLEYQAESAVAIVAEPKTGAILAMVSLPDYEPAAFNRTDPNNLRNRAITDQFEPGSLIKPVAASIALDAGAVNRTEKIFCENGNYHGRGFGSIGEYREGFGSLTVRGILVNSSNIGMAKIGQRTGKEKLYDGLKRFGFGELTGIDLPGEQTGLLRPTRQWTGYSVTRIPFGHEITVTAMQMVRAFCILANGGHPVKPYLVQAIVNNEGEIEKLKRPPPQVGYVIDPEIAKWIVTDALVGVVNEGTGKRARLDKWQLFGKTGTANIAMQDQRGYSDRYYIASFMAGAPAEDPRIICLVSIRRPNRSLGKGYTGGAVASPVVAEIIEKSLTYMENNSLVARH
jgi:cell division protein FtsI (penicillin-binding protein 3)